MSKRKNFSYRNATVAEIVEHFKHSSSQAIYLARRTWKGTEKESDVEEAYRTYKISVLDAKLSQK